ncbi:hypothetical protein MMC22_010081 [Lobaria immixta]|nr:hypothetical protein [Lobaria immixta]
MEGKFGAPAPCRSEWPASFIRELEEAAKADDVAQNEQMIDISLAGAAVDLTKTVEILDFSKDDLDMQPAMEDRFGAPALSNSESLASFICELEEAEDIDQNEQTVHISLLAPRLISLKSWRLWIPATTNLIWKPLQSIETDSDDECTDLEDLVQEPNNLFEDNSHVATTAQIRPTSPLPNALSRVIDYSKNE